MEDTDVESIPLRFHQLPDPAPVAGCSKPPPLRCSRPDAPFDRHIGNNGMVQSAAEAATVFLPQTSRRLAASSCRGCAYRPIAAPIDRDRPAPRPSFQSEVL